MPTSPRRFRIIFRAGQSPAPTHVLMCRVSVPCLSLWERWPSAARTERANKKDCKALSVTCGDSSPKGRADELVGIIAPAPQGRATGRRAGGRYRNHSPMACPPFHRRLAEKWSVSLVIRSILCLITAHQRQGGGCFSGGQRRTMSFFIPRVMPSMESWYMSKCFSSSSKVWVQ